jgi:hypothetical protein
VWWVTCLLAEPQQCFLARVLSASAWVTLEQGEEIAAETQLRKTWALGLTSAPASSCLEGRILLKDTASLIGGEAAADLDWEPDP